MTQIGMKNWLGFGVLAVACIGAVPIRAHAQGTLEFTLEEIEAAGKPDAQKDPKEAKGPPIARALGELRWGMSKNDVLALLKKRIRADYAQRIKREKNIMRQDALYRQANEAFRRVKDGYIEFDGHKTGWDASAIAEEFAHGSGESMLVVDDPSARDLYFFFHDRLWKWYRELKPAAYGGANFDGVSGLLKEQFGKTKERAEPRSDGGPAYRMLSWSDKETRVSAIWRGSETCLVFEQRQTLEHLAELREHALPKHKKRNGVLDGVIMTTAQREAWREAH